MNGSQSTQYSLDSLPVEIRYIVWEYTWPSPTVIEPLLYRYDDNNNGDTDDSSDEEEDSSDDERVIILHPMGSLSTFFENSLATKGLADSPTEKFRPPVALSVCHESRKYTLQHYHRLHHREIASPNFYFNPKRDILWFGDSRVHNHLFTLRQSYGDLLLQIRNILLDNSNWEDEALRNDTLKSLRMFGTIHCILISDRDTVRLAKDDDGVYLVPDSDKVIARANRYRTEYEQFLRTLENQNEAEKQVTRRGIAGQIWCVDSEGYLY